MKFFNLLPGVIFSKSSEPVKDYSGYKVLRAQWIDPIVSRDVEKILGSVENLDVWVPESLDLIHETRSIDFMISPHQNDNITKLLKMNTVESELVYRLIETKT